MNRKQCFIVGVMAGLLYWNMRQTGRLIESNNRIIHVLKIWSDQSEQDDVDETFEEIVDEHLGDLDF